jgi:hypothetical protein
MEAASPVSRLTSPGPILSGAGDRLPSPTLPSQPTRLIDREDELALLRALLSQGDVRLLTLTGLGGQDAAGHRCRRARAGALSRRGLVR